MKKLVIAMFAVALVTPMFAQEKQEPTKTEKTSKKKKVSKKKSTKKAEEPKAQ